MAKINRTLKRNAQTALTNALASATNDGGASAVAVFGKFGERGVAFFPSRVTTRPETGAMVGFSLIGNGINGGHLNLSRADAKNLVELLVTEYGFNVTTRPVTTTTIAVS